MKKYSYLLVVLWVLIFSSFINADTYSEFVTTEYFSKNRKFFVRVTPDRRAVLFKNGKKVWSKVFPQLPMNMLVTNDGKRVVMIENYYGNNREAKREVIIFFDETGNRLAGFALENLADLQNVQHTISASHWLNNYEFNQEESQLSVKTMVLTCPLFNVFNDEDMKKLDECIKPKPKENIIFSVTDGNIISRIEFKTEKK